MALNDIFKQYFNGYEQTNADELHYIKLIPALECIVQALKPHPKMIQFYLHIIVRSTQGSLIHPWIGSENVCYRLNTTTKQR